MAGCDSYKNEKEKERCEKGESARLLEQQIEKKTAARKETEQTHRCILTVLSGNRYEINDGCADKGTCHLGCDMWGKYVRSDDAQKLLSAMLHHSVADKDKPSELNELVKDKEIYSNSKKILEDLFKAKSISITYGNPDDDGGVVGTLNLSDYGGGRRRRRRKSRKKRRRRRKSRRKSKRRKKTKRRKRRRRTRRRR